MDNIRTILERLRCKKNSLEKIQYGQHLYIISNGQQSNLQLSAAQRDIFSKDRNAIKMSAKERMEW